MRAGTALKIGLVLVVALGVAAVAVIKSIDVDSYRGFVETQVRQATGRDFTIGGPLEMGISLTPSIVATDVRLANADWGSRPQMATISRLEAQLALLPLLSGEVQIKRLVLIEPDLLLETNARGRGNWEFATSGEEKTASSSPTGGQPPQLEISQLRVEKGNVTYRDGEETHTVVIEQFRFESASRNSPVDVSFLGAIDSRRVDAKGSLGQLSELLTQTKRYPIRMQVNSGGIVASAEGEIGDLRNFSGVELTFRTEGTEFAEVLRLFSDRPEPAVGPFRISGRVQRPEMAWVVPEIDLAVGKSEFLRVSAKGSIGELPRADALDLSVSVASKNLANASDMLFGAELPAIPLEASAQLSSDAKSYQLRDFALTAGESTLNGDLSADMSGRKPRVTGQLSAPLLDSASFSGAPTEQKAEDGPVFSPDPLPFDLLNSFDADIDLAVEKLVVAQIAAEQVTGKLSVKDGRLGLDDLQGQVEGGGTLDGRLALNAANQGSAALKIEARDVILGALLAKSGATDMLQGGRSDVSIDVVGSGPSLDAIMGSLDGRATLVSDKSQLQSGNVRFLAYDVLNQLVKGEQAGDATAIGCIVGRFDIRKGIAKSEVFLVDTPTMTIGAKGGIDLGAERYDMTIVPRPKEASLINLATPLDITGPLRNPRITPNEAAVAGTIAGAVAGGAINPLGVLIPFVTSGSADENPCVAAIANAAKTPAAQPQAGSSNPLNDIVKGIEGLFGR